MRRNFPSPPAPEAAAQSEKRRAGHGPGETPQGSAAPDSLCRRVKSAAPVRLGDRVPPLYKEPAPFPRREAAPFLIREPPSLTDSRQDSEPGAPRRQNEASRRTLGVLCRPPEAKRRPLRRLLSGSGIAPRMFGRTQSPAPRTVKTRHAPQDTLPPSPRQGGVPRRKSFAVCPPAPAAPLRSRKPP